MENLGKNRDEVYSHFKKSCKTEKEAMEKTNAHMKALEEEREEEKGEKGEFKKSLDAGIDKIRKSVASLNDIATLIATKQTAVVQVDADMKKSITTLREEPDKFSGEEFMGQNTHAFVTTATNQNEILSQLTKSLATLAEGIADVFPLLKSVHDVSIDAVEQASDANEVARYLVRHLKKSMQGFTRSTDAIDAADGGEVVSEDQMLKSINIRPVKAYLVDRQVALNDTNPALAKEYSNAHRALEEMGNEGFTRMSKSIVTEIVTWIKPQLPVHQQ